MFAFPEDWHDDERMAFLFRDFKPREYNPLGYDEKLDFWKSLIKSYTLQRSKATFTVQSLMNDFVRKNSQPVCLEKVIEQLKVDRVVLVAESSTGWVAWISSWFARPSESSETVLLINAKVLHESTEDLKAVIRGAEFREPKIPYRQVWDACKQTCENNETLFKYALSSLASFDGTYVVFAKNSDLIKPLNEHDRALSAISDASRKLEIKIDQCVLALDGLKAEALRNKANGNTSAAIRNLRKKRRMEKIVEKQYQTLDKLHEMQADVENQKDLPKILGSFKLAVSALKSVNGDADKIHDIVDELQEATTEQREIEETISAPIGFKDDTDVQDLEDELLKLMEENEPIPDFPPVPNEEPSKLPTKEGDEAFIPKRIALGYFE